MAYNIIPLTSNSDQYFTSSIPVDGKNLTLSFRLRYNTIAGYWVMTIANTLGNIYIDSMPLLGVLNLLEQYKYLNIGSAYIVKNGKVADDSPTENNLGIDFLLYWGDTNG